MKYERLWTIGIDYTFDIGDGLYVLTEYSSTINSDKVFGSGEGVNFLGLSLNYPIGMLDNLSGIYYRDWTNQDNYLTLTWSRTYDNWIFYLIAFSNPETVSLSQSQSNSNAFAGNGFQIMVVFNH